MPNKEQEENAQKTKEKKEKAKESLKEKKRLAKELIDLVKQSQSTKTKEIKEKIEQLADLQNKNRLKRRQWLEILLEFLEGTSSDAADKKLMEISIFIVKKDLISLDNTVPEKILHAMLNRKAFNANKSPPVLKKYNEFMELIEKKFSSSASQKMSSVAADLLEKGLKTKNPYYAACLPVKLFEHINFRDVEMDKKRLITKVCKQIQKHPKGRKYLKDILDGVFWEKFYNKKHFTPQSSTQDLIKPTLQLFVFLDGTDLTMSTRFSTKVYYSILHFLLAQHCTNPSALSHLEEFLPYVRSRSEQHDSHKIQERCKYIVHHVRTDKPPSEIPEIALVEAKVDVVVELIDFAEMRAKYNDDDNSHADIHKHIPAMIQILSDQTSEQRPHALKLLEDIGHAHTEELIAHDGLDEFVGNDNADTTYIITRIAKKNPEALMGRDAIDDYLNQIENSETTLDMANVVIYQIFSVVARFGKEEAEDVFFLEYNEFNLREDYDSLIPLILYQWQELAYLFPELIELQRYNGYLEMCDFLEDPATQAQAQHLVDTVDGKNPLNSSNLMQHKETPRWIAQVSEMLNSEQKNDWRIVARRIGFSPQEIKKWSEEAALDGAQTMLFKFYSNNQIATIDATHFLLSVLKQLERFDVVDLIDYTGEGRENVIPEHERKVDPEMIYSVASEPGKDNELPPVV